MKNFVSRILIVLFLLCIMSGFGVPKAAAQSFSFTAAGDFSLGSNAQQVVAAMDTNSAFSVGMGDFVYGSDGQGFCYMVINGTSSTYSFDVIAGNHDTGESDPNIMPTLVGCLPHRAGTAATGTYGHNYYFDYPAVNPTARFILIRPGVSSTGTISYTVGSAGYTFTSSAIDDARAKGIKWVVVGMHKNYISAQTKGNEVGNDIMNLMFTKKVDLILQGHEHGYQRSKQLSCARSGTFDASCVADSDNDLIKGAGSVILILGTGGQSWRGQNTGDAEFPYFAKGDGTTNSFGFGRFTVSSAAITYSYQNATGGSLTDSFTITDTGSNPPTPTPTVTISPIATLTPTNTPTVSQCPVLPTNTGTVTSSTILTQTGTYKVWSRINSASSASSAYWIQIDNGCAISVGGNLSAANQWVWVDYKDGNTGSKITMNLQSGSHTVKIIGKDPNVSVDRIIFTLNQQCTPTGAVGAECLDSASPTIIPECVLKSKGDADCSGKLDLIDYEKWRREFLGIIITTTADFDTNATTKPDLIDYEIWRRGFLGI